MWTQSHPTSRKKKKKPRRHRKPSSYLHIKLKWAFNSQVPLDLVEHLQEKVISVSRKEEIVQIVPVFSLAHDKGSGIHSDVTEMSMSLST
jgi:hypothetical protein